jgi:hypothetical protein
VKIVVRFVDWGEILDQIFLRPCRDDLLPKIVNQAAFEHMSLRQGKAVARKLHVHLPSSSFGIIRPSAARPVS